MGFVNRFLKFTVAQGSLLLVLATPISAAVSDLYLDDCLQRAKDQQLSSVNLQGECPQLFVNLQTIGVLDAIDPPIVEDVAVLQLMALATMLQQNDVNWVLDDQGLNDLLKGIRVFEKKDQSMEWWDRFLDWLKSKKPEKYEAEFQWLIKMINALMPSEQTLKIFTKVMIYCLIAISLGIIVWEIYLAGAFSRFGFQRKTNDAAKPVSTVTDQSGLVLAEVSQLSPSEQVSALLNYAITGLIDQQQLPEDRSLTNQEMSKYLQQKDAPAKHIFSQLVQQSEPVIYGNLQPGSVIVDQCWEMAELIHAD